MSCIWSSVSFKGSIYLDNVLYVKVITTGCPKKSARRLILCKLKTTVFTQSAFTFSEFSYFNLKFVIKQSKIG